jgi:hypothetical protein
VTARQARNHFCGVWPTAQVLLYSLELSTGREFSGTWVDFVANWIISRSWRRSMEKLLLTVREAADVLTCESVAGV